MFKKLLEKIKSTYTVQNYMKIMPYVKPYWFRGIMSVLVTIPIGGMDAVIAWALRPYMDIVMVEKNTSSTSYIPILIIVFSILQSGLNYLASYLNTWFGRKLANDVKFDLYKKLMHREPAYFDNTSSGEVMYRYSGDVDVACSGLLSNIKLFATRFFSSISLIGVLIYNSWQLAIVAIVVLIGALLPLTTVRRRIKSLIDKSIFFGAKATTLMNETYAGNRIITSYNLYDIQYLKFRNMLNDLFKIGIKGIQRVGLMSPLMHLVVSVGIAVVIWLGSYLIVTKQITAGAFVSFVTALIMLYNPIKSIGGSFTGVQASLLAMERVFGLLEAEPTIRSKAKAKKIAGVKDKVVFKNVNFEYVKGKPVLKNISLEAKVGETVALVGNSGGGKSTIVSLLPRFYDVKSGSITIDGTDVRDIELKSLRDQIAVVFQDNFLFTGTIRDNIMLGNLNASEEEVRKAVKSACLEEFVNSLDKGLDTEIGERGVLLSGGQKQRIAIARAFLKNAPIVVLDEATSALDNKSEAIVQQAIDNLMRDRTVFVIAHRLSTVRHADKIIVINYGEIVEEGSHEKLVDKPNGAYAALYKMQLK